MLTEDDDSTNDSINYEINRESNTPLLSNPITIHEAKTCITKQKSTKSPGSDNIINEYIKCTQDLQCPLYGKLFNSTVDGGVFHTIGRSIVYKQGRSKM